MLIKIGNELIDPVKVVRVTKDFDGTKIFYATENEPIKIDEKFTEVVRVIKLALETFY